MLHRMQEKFLETQVAFLKLTEGQRNEPLTFDSAKELLQKMSALKRNHVERLIKLLELVWSTQDNVVQRNFAKVYINAEEIKSLLDRIPKAAAKEREAIATDLDLFNQAYHKAQCSFATVKQLYRQVLSTLNLKGSTGPQMRKDAQWKYHFRAGTRSDIHRGYPCAPHASSMHPSGDPGMGRRARAFSSCLVRRAEEAEEFCQRCRQHAKLAARRSSHSVAR
jgi:hypothetical protein